MSMEFDENYIYVDDSYSTNELHRASSYMIVKANDLERIRNNIIAECEEFTCLSRDEAIIVLIQYQWNIDRVRDQWYDDVEENRRVLGLDMSKESMDQLARRKIPRNNDDCLVCFTPRDETFFALNCSHFFCGDCWRNYLETRLEDIHTCISSSCPQGGCNIIVPEGVFKIFISKEKLKEFEKSVFKNFTDNNIDIKWCPAPDCGICIRSLVHSMKEITCECQCVFCFRCTKEGHRPCQCEMVQLWELKNSSESENVKWLQANTKQCPGCHKFIEKNQGCNHMTCRKEAGGCGYEFCWICMGEWAPHGSSYYQCNRFDAKKAEESEKSQKQAKFELERYIFHFDRYVNHDKAQKLSIKMRSTIQEEIKIFNAEKLLPYDEMRFLEDAVETIIKSRRVLKNTYVFGYYMKDCNERKLFEHNQNLLEKDADQLHEMMENETKKNLLKITNHEEFWKCWTNFKSSVINLSTVTVKYMENLLSEIENKMMDLVNYKELK